MEETLVRNKVEKMLTLCRYTHDLMDIKGLLGNMDFNEKLLERHLKHGLGDRSIDLLFAWLIEDMYIYRETNRTMSSIYYLWNSIRKHKVYVPRDIQYSIVHFGLILSDRLVENIITHKCSIGYELLVIVEIINNHDIYTIQEIALRVIRNATIIIESNSINFNNILDNIIDIELYITEFVSKWVNKTTTEVALEIKNDIWNVGEE